jgi:hypothetical protein
MTPLNSWWTSASPWHQLPITWASAIREVRRSDVQPASSDSTKIWTQAIYPSNSIQLGWAKPPTPTTKLWPPGGEFVRHLGLAPEIAAEDMHLGDPIDELVAGVDGVDPGEQLRDEGVGPRPRDRSQGPRGAEPLAGDRSARPAARRRFQSLVRASPGRSAPRRGARPGRAECAIARRSPSGGPLGRSSTDPGATMPPMIVAGRGDRSSELAGTRSDSRRLVVTPEPSPGNVHWT